MKSMLHSTALRPIFGIGFASIALQVDVEQRQAHVGLGDLVLRRRARDQQDLVGALRVGRPDLAAVDA